MGRTALMNKETRSSERLGLCLYRDSGIGASSCRAVEPKKLICRPDRAKRCSARISFIESTMPERRRFAPCCRPASFFDHLPAATCKRLCGFSGGTGGLSRRCFRYRPTLADKPPVAPDVSCVGDLHPTERHPTWTAPLLAFEA